MSVSKLATALTAIFVVSLVALVAELSYVLWRRRSFCRQIPPVQGSAGAHNTDLPVDFPSSKELLYFFCLKTEARIEPSGSPARESVESLPEDPVIDVFKLLEANGPSRFLCTIKEEDDREDVDESEDSAKKSERECLQACLEKDGKSPEVAVVVDVDGDVDVDVETTPFSTPCASPQYFTPLASPSRDIECGVSIHEIVL